VRSRLLGIGAVAVLVVLGFVVFGGKDDSYILKVRFKDSDGLRVHSDVKIGGVPGGEIASLQLLPGDVAQATVHLKKNAAPIGAGASAKVRPVNLLGEKYVDLRPGDPSKPMKSGAVIPASATSGPVELDDVFNMLDSGTRARLRILINESGLGLAGRGTDFNKLLSNLPPALDDTKKVLDEIRSQTAVMKHAITQGDADLAAISPKRDDLGRLVDHAQAALRVAAAKRTDLGRTVAAAPGALTQLRSTLGDLRTTSARLVPASKDLLSASGPLASTLQRLPEFVDSAKPTLRTATEVSGDLGRLGQRGAPVIKRLRPTAEKLSNFATEADPLVKTLADQNGLNAMYGLMNGWDKTIQTRDGLGHVFRLRPELDAELLTHALAAYGPPGLLKALNPKKAAKAPAAKAPAAQAPAAKKPSLLPSILDPAVGAVNKIVGQVSGVLKGVTTGLTGGGTKTDHSGDSSRLLDYLLGGS
jgi:phospholipid/cholesterol/gamma-HCH transport system substrate-binding protein